MRARAWLFVAAFTAACAGSAPSSEHAAQPRGAGAPEPATSAPASASAVASAPQPEPLPPCDPLEVPPHEVPDKPINPPVPEIVDATGALEPFWEQLAELARGKGDRPIRIGFYGDSNLTLDFLSGTLRRELQKRFGDAGHGYIGVGVPFRGYRHWDVRRRHFGHWKPLIYSHHFDGRQYGSAGMAGLTKAKGARVEFRTARDASPVGHNASRFTVYYMVQPEGSRFEVHVDGELHTTVDTAGEVGVGEHVVKVEDGPHEFVVKNIEKKWLRLFGVALERDRPGIVLDTMGITGATYFDMARVDAKNFTDMLKLRHYDLVMFMLGTNFWKQEENPRVVPKVLGWHRSIRADVPILFFSPPDHTKGKRAIRSDPRVVRATEIIEQITRENDTAFWNLREAMGGEASMSKFYRWGLAGKDLYHFTFEGGKFLGQRATRAFIDGLRGYVSANPRAGCDGKAPP